MRRGLRGRATCEDDVVDEEEISAGDVEVDLGCAYDGGRADLGEVVAIEGDVERAVGDVGESAVFEKGHEATGEFIAAATNADHADRAAVGNGRGQFTGEAGEGLADRVFVEERFHRGP